MNVELLSDADRLCLAREVYDVAFRAFETFSETGPSHHNYPTIVGADVAYLMGAILSNGKCQWEEGQSSLVATLELSFPPEHPLWTFIEILPMTGNTL